MQRLAYPSALLTCADDPDIPAGPLSDREIMIYILDLWAAGDDCRARLAQLKQLSQSP